MVFGEDSRGESDEEGGDGDSLVVERDNRGEYGLVGRLEGDDGGVGGEGEDVDDALDGGGVGGGGEGDAEGEVEGEGVEGEERFADVGELHVEGRFAERNGGREGELAEEGGVEDVGEPEGESGFVGKTLRGFREWEGGGDGSNGEGGKSDGLHKMEKFVVGMRQTRKMSDVRGIGTKGLDENIRLVGRLDRIWLEREVHSKYCSKRSILP